MQYSHLILKWF